MAASVWTDLNWLLVLTHTVYLQFKSCLCVSCTKEELCFPPQVSHLQKCAHLYTFRLQTDLLLCLCNYRDHYSCLCTRYNHWGQVPFILSLKNCTCSFSLMYYSSCHTCSRWVHVRRTFRLTRWLQTSGVCVGIRWSFLWACVLSAAPV